MDSSPPPPSSPNPSSDSSPDSTPSEEPHRAVPPIKENKVRLKKKAIKSKFKKSPRSSTQDLDDEKDSSPVDLNLTKVSLKPDQYPIVASQNYNISFFGVEKLHPFDSNKWGRIMNFLIDEKFLTKDQFVTPISATDKDLLFVHTKKYLDSLNQSSTLANITEIPIGFVPNSLLQSALVKPLKLQVGGSLMAAFLATRKGWGINLGGGFHHCHRSGGGGFCVFADISLIVKFLVGFFGIQTFLIIDLDAHQGNGHERDFINHGTACVIKNNQAVRILDVYNSNIYPGDTFAKAAIDYNVPLQSYTENSKYISTVSKWLDKVFTDFKPEFIIYNAGTDVLVGDPLGALSVTAEGIVKRDELVWTKAINHKIPIVMLTSGGYQKNNAKIIAASIVNLEEKLGLKKYSKTFNPIKPVPSSMSTGFEQYRKLIAAHEPVSKLTLGNLQDSESKT